MARLPSRRRGRRPPRRGRWQQRPPQSSLGERPDRERVGSTGAWLTSGELKKRLERNNLGGRIIGIETIDKMTDRQIAAKVRQHFPT